MIAPWTTGCAFSKVKWIEPANARPLGERAYRDNSELADAERFYSQALRHQDRCQQSCVDLFYHVALLTAHHELCSSSSCRGHQLHQSALRLLLHNGQAFNRFDPARGLLVRHSGNEEWIPIEYHGFVWDSGDFCRLIPVGDYKTRALSSKHRFQGIGIPLVVEGCNKTNQPFLPEQSFLAATMRLHVDATSGPQFRLYDPLRVKQTKIGGRLYPLARDLSASLAYRLRGVRQNVLNEFLYPDTVGDSRLYTLEPYQAGKIPIVLIHGLFSDPYTWVEMVNELRASPGLLDHYQIWVFEYPTGQAFLRSAAELRGQLLASHQCFDPLHQDPQLSKMVLVGHSMGGLIAKLQITSSGNRLWKSVAKLPFDQLDIPAELRGDLISSFFFQPVPYVSRVLFMGTPHRGSNYARRLIGRLGSSLVRRSSERQESYEVMIASNPGVFSDEVTDRIPTSIDLLDPDSGLLKSIEQLPIRECVTLHSVIGDRCGTILHGRSDGVVPVESAREHRAQTERIIRSRHVDVNEHPEAIEELLRILSAHFSEESKVTGSPPLP